MRGRTKAYAAAVTTSLLLLAIFDVGFAAHAEADQNPQSSPPSSQYPSASWALGVVAPEGAPLEGGGALRWGGVTNVTVVLNLPNISLPGGIVYAVVSVMTSDGSVLQAAAGIYPNQSSWRSYSWSIPDIDAVPLAYQWVLNGTAPSMSPGAAAAISVFRANGVWNLKVEDLDSGLSVAEAFPSGGAHSLESGDQEVFALESYSRSASTFRYMGNLTLRELLVGGIRVVGGFYSYSDWDTIHNPVFAVGSSGMTPPGFVSIGLGADGSIVWSYVEGWQGSGGRFQGIAFSIGIVGAVGASLLGAVLWLTRGKGARSPAPSVPPRKAKPG